MLALFLEVSTSTARAWGTSSRVARIACSRTSSATRKRSPSVNWSGGKSGGASGRRATQAFRPRLADVADFDRSFLSAFSAWTEMQKKLAAYNAVASRPWMKAAEKYQSTAGVADKAFSGESWRSLLGSWTALVDAGGRTDDWLGTQDAARDRGLAPELAGYLATRPDLDDVAVICADVPSATKAQSGQLAASWRIMDSKRLSKLRLYGSARGCIASAKIS